MDDQQFYNKIVQGLAHMYKNKLEEDRLVSARIAQFEAEQIKPLFPHKTNLNQQGEMQQYSCNDVCCTIDFGHFCCGQIAQGSKQINELGLGISLYMKFVCYLVSFFLIAILLVAVPLYLYYQASYQNNSLMMDLNSVLYSSTIGSLTANLYQCNYVANTPSFTFQLSCNVGTINLYDPVYSNKSFVSVQTCQAEIDNSINQMYSIDGVMQKNCSDKLCNISFTNSNLDSQHLFVSVGYSCLDPEYKVIDYPINSNIIILITISTDLVAVILFLVWMCLQTKSEKKLVQHFNKKEISLDDFTIELKGLSMRNQLLSQCVSKFIASFGSTILARTRKDITISKFKVCDNEEKISDQYSKKEIYEKLFQKKFEKLFAEGIDPMQMTLNQFDAVVEFHKFRKDVEKIFAEFKPYIYESTHRPYSIFITFETPQMATRILNMCQKSCLTGKQMLKIQNKRYKIRRAVRPDLIQWQNLNSHYIIRTLFSWLITLIILVLSYFMIAASQIGQSQILDRFDFKTNCSLLFKSEQLLTWHQSLKSNTNWINCYCSSNWGEIFNHTDCQSWLKNYSFYLFSPMFISLLIVIFNMIVSFIFKQLSKFEKHSNVCNELYSYIIKRALLLILNAGFIIVIVNQKLGVKSSNPVVSFLFGGQFNNFDASWYYNIGQVIIFTNLFNIVMPIFEVVIRSIFKCLLKMIDTRCCRQTTSMTSKQSYKDLYSGIPFPIEERYAEILSLLILTFAYNAVIPILNIVAMLSFIFQYLSDKIMIFYIYRKPPNYDQNLQRRVRKTIIFCIIVHLVVSIFFLPTQGININSGLNLDIGSLNRNSTLKLIASQIYIYPYLFLLALVLVWVVFRNTIGYLFTCCFSRCFNKCNATKEQYYSVEKNQLKVYDLFNDHQIQQLLRVNRAELVKTQNDQDIQTFKKGINLTVQSLFVAAFKIIVDEHGDIQIPQNWDSLDNYRKILFEERAQLKARQKQIVRVKLNGLPGYDPIFEKENHLMEVLRLEKIVHGFYNPEPQEK